MTRIAMLHPLTAARTLRFLWRCMVNPDMCPSSRNPLRRLAIGADYAWHHYPNFRNV